MFLKLENTVKYVDADSVDDLKLSKEVPVGVWKLSCAQYVGFYLEETEIKLSHGKIYGDAQDIADHVAEAFEKTIQIRILVFCFQVKKVLVKHLLLALFLKSFMVRSQLL